MELFPYNLRFYTLVYLLMNEIDNNQIKTILFDLSKKFILPKFRNLNKDDIKRKVNNDLVTSVDLCVEKELNTILCNMIPGSLFVGEEQFSLSSDIEKSLR